MLLERDKIVFPTDLKFGGDYVALLNCNYNWPLSILSSGLIRYDTKGVSSANRWASDLCTNKIIKKRFGTFWQIVHLIRSIAKLCVKKLYFWGSR